MGERVALFTLRVRTLRWHLFGFLIGICEVNQDPRHATVASTYPSKPVAPFVCFKEDATGEVPRACGRYMPFPAGSQIGAETKSSTGCMTKIVPQS